MTKINVSDEIIDLENIITESLFIAKNYGLEEVIKYLSQQNDTINKSYE